MSLLPPPCNVQQIVFFCFWLHEVGLQCCMKISFVTVPPDEVWCYFKLPVYFHQTLEHQFDAKRQHQRYVLSPALQYPCQCWGNPSECLSLIYHIVLSKRPPPPASLLRILGGPLHGNSWTIQALSPCNRPSSKFGAWAGSAHGRLLETVRYVAKNFGIGTNLVSPAVDSCNFFFTKDLPSSLSRHLSHCHLGNLFAKSLDPALPHLLAECWPLRLCSWWRLQSLRARMTFSANVAALSHSQPSLLQ